MQAINHIPAVRCQKTVASYLHQKQLLADVCRRLYLICALESRRAAVCTCALNCNVLQVSFHARHDMWISHFFGRGSFGISFHLCPHLWFSTFFLLMPRFTLFRSYICGRLLECSHMCEVGVQLVTTSSTLPGLWFQVCLQSDFSNNSGKCHFIKRRPQCELTLRRIGEGFDQTRSALGTSVSKVDWHLLAERRGQGHMCFWTWSCWHIILLLHKSQLSVVSWPIIWFAWRTTHSVSIQALWIQRREMTPDSSFRYR